MKFKSIPLLLLLPALMVLLGACGGGGLSEADIKATVQARLTEARIETTVEAKIEEEIAAEAAATATAEAITRASVQATATARPSSPMRISASVATPTPTATTTAEAITRASVQATATAMPSSPMRISASVATPTPTATTTPTPMLALTPTPTVTPPAPGLPSVTPTPYPTPTVTPVAVGTGVTVVPTATKVLVKAAPMQSLPVDVSAVLSAGPIANSLRTFSGFGMPKPHDPNQRIPQWEFSVPLGTPALSPVSGTVWRIPTLWSDDYSVMIQTVEGGWIWEVEHVMNVEVNVGERVEAGQKIATASDFPERINGTGLALVEVGLLEGGRVPTHHCPLPYIDQNMLLSITADLDAIRQENLQRLDKQGLISDPVNDPYGQACWTHDPIREE